MYTEFIIIYIGLGILALLSIANIILLIMLLKNNVGGKIVTYKNNIGNSNKYVSMNGQTGVVFCKNCATRFDASTRICPKCGTQR